MTTRTDNLFRWLPHGHIAGTRERLALVAELKGDLRERDEYAYNALTNEWINPSTGHRFEITNSIGQSLVALAKIGIGSTRAFEMIK